MRVEEEAGGEGLGTEQVQGQVCRSEEQQGGITRGPQDTGRPRGVAPLRGFEQSYCRKDWGQRQEQGGWKE